MEIKIDGRVYPLFRKDLDRRRKLGEVDTASFSIALIDQTEPAAGAAVVLTSAFGIYFRGTVTEVETIADAPTARFIKCVGLSEPDTNN